MADLTESIRDTLSAFFCRSVSLITDKIKKLTHGEVARSTVLRNYLFNSSDFPNHNER